jgi:hypothetical protein
MRILLNVPDPEELQLADRPARQGKQAAALPPAARRMPSCREIVMTHSVDGRQEPGRVNRSPCPPRRIVRLRPMAQPLPMPDAQVTAQKGNGHQPDDDFHSRHTHHLETRLSEIRRSVMHHLQPPFSGKWSELPLRSVGPGVMKQAWKSVQLPWRELHAHVASRRLQPSPLVAYFMRPMTCSDKARPLPVTDVWPGATGFNASSGKR